jgi:preprotein translocase subunit SecD
MTAQDNIISNVSTAEIEEEFGFVFSDNVVSSADINNIILGNVGDVVANFTDEVDINDL